MIKTHLKRVCGAVFIAVFVVLLFRIAWINRLFPPIESVQIQKGEHYTYNGFDMSVMDFKIQRLDQFFQTDKVKELDKSYYIELGSLEDSYVLIVTLAVKNKNGVEARMPFYELSLTDTVWHNDFDLAIFQTLNKDVKIIETMKDQEETTVILPYVLTKAQFSQARWNKVEDNNYYLDIAVYPKHISLLVN